MESQGRPSTIYGPVQSWRFGRSLGIDPICGHSTCSFNCIYCQLGRIQEITRDRRVFIPIEWLREDLAGVDWQSVDAVTLSGNGEPTLAANLGEVIHAAREFWTGPLHLLTNATLLHLPEVRRAIKNLDLIACKLDAPDQAALERINRIADGVRIETIVEGILALRAEYSGHLALQIMIMPGSVPWIDALISLIRRIGPDSVQLNTPRRSYPLEPALEYRGAHRPEDRSGQSRLLSVIEPAEAIQIARRIREACGVVVEDVYREKGG